MIKLRVGVWLHDNLKPEAGGGFGYYIELLNAINKYSFKDAEIVFLSDKNIFANNFKVQVLKEKSLKLKIFNIVLNIINKMHPLLVIFKKIMQRAIDKSRNEIYQYADVIYYLTPDCAYPDFPYIYTLWDLGHYNTYAFPELSMNGAFESRKRHHDFLPHKALMLFTESETGKKQCEQYLNINKERVKVVPVFPSGVVNFDCKPLRPIKIKESDFFIHYPAQYWAHKNHYNLLVAMVLVIKKFPEIKLVLTGSDKGNKTYILKVITELKLEKNVVDLGFVSIEELRWLYERSQGLVMPTLLGPTNMPLLEAAELGCPVACTDLPGHIEQLGDCGYYFNGLDPNQVATQILAMIDDKKNGVMKKYDNRFNINNTLKAIDKNFTELKKIRFCWGKDDRIS